MITLTDMFCGAGGSSTGAIQVPGVEVKLAMNHWALAIETHNTNHPTADHALADISAADPRFYPGSDILWASPECTNHSVARGKKRNVDATPDLFDEVLPDEAADRSRATMWDVPRFAERHRYKAIITENVVDAAKWIQFPAWLYAMELLGYDKKIVYLNSMHAQAAGLPAPQSRDRMYVVFWLKGNRAPDIEKWTRPKAYCPTCDETVNAMQVFKKQTEWGRYRAQFLYRCPRVKCRNSVVEPGWLPAASAIDWSIEGARIGDRPKPLAPKTLARIQAGLDKFSGEPFLSQFRERMRNIDPFVDPLTTIVADGANHGLVHPSSFTLEATAVMRGQSKNHPVDQPISTVLVGGIHHAFVTTLRGTNAPKSVAEPLDTFAANGLHHGLADATSIDITDCMFRMLEPHEIARGMAFTEGYKILGNKREQVKQAGNAVTPPAARDLISAVAESLVGAA
ncbi:DNA cytosine methyltransferase [Rhodococcus sp. 1168]|uniref:DNA cytosine methyltransferase n=1 Tax=Rhodococcus sp. 1168 TaxID=2018041 RepID=UPI000A0C2EEA|nr:DNA cytosine methyltransferase [Rhodococcus sp. 1168]ORI13465.1 DNA methyltransferase [Rhodococcus sp. 1168]